MDLYATLGVPRSATFDEIRSAYKRLSLRHHPNRPGGDEEEFKKIQLAHEVLTNPGRRRVYDQTGQAQEGYVRADPAASPTAAAAAAAAEGEGGGRRKRTIDPERITTLEQWVQAYGRYVNVVIGDDGVPVVLARDDSGTVVKRFPLAKGYDLYVVLQRNIETRKEAALAKLSELTTELTATVVAATTAFLAAEQALLEATDRWRSAPTPLARQIAASDVGRASTAVSAADSVKRSAEAPRRHVAHVENVTRNEMDYRSKDGRVYPSFYQLYPTRFGPKDSILTEEDMA